MITDKYIYIMNEERRKRSSLVYEINVTCNCMWELGDIAGDIWTFGSPHVEPVAQLNI